MTPSEELVYRLCERSFLALWSFARPRGKNAKELCDVLVVCSPHVIIFSVKDVEAKQSGNEALDWERWTRAAVDESVKQIFGAERWLAGQRIVIRSDGSEGVHLPDLAERRVFRVAVALGSGGRIPIASPRSPRGEVHVFDERALEIILSELDTITDFCDYLTAKEDQLRGKLVVAEGEESLLAVYLRYGRKFPGELDALHLDGDLWANFVRNPAYEAKKQADRDSNAFDEIIERISAEVLSGTLEIDSHPSETERVLRVMAREPRFHRRMLGRSFKECLLKSARHEAGNARLTFSPSGVTYVYLAARRERPREDRIEELSARCIIARALKPENKTVVGIATERLDGRVGLSIDCCLLDLPSMSEEQRREAERLRSELGLFAEPEWFTNSEDEYPTGS